METIEKYTGPEPKTPLENWVIGFFTKRRFVEKQEFNCAIYTQEEIKNAIHFLLAKRFDVLEINEPSKNEATDYPPNMHLIVTRPKNPKP